MSRFARLLVLGFLACADPHRGASDTTTTTPPVVQNGHDWTRFNYDAARTGTSTADVGLTAASIPTMRRQQVTLDGVVDASAIYLNNIQVNGAAHDVFFVTTEYGKTQAVDANDGTILWTFTPPNYRDRKSVV